MIDLEQLVEVQINRSNRKGYRNQGFDCDMGDIIQVKMKNLYRPANSIRIKVICENNRVKTSMFEMPFADFVNKYLTVND